MIWVQWIVPTNIFMLKLKGLNLDEKGDYTVIASKVNTYFQHIKKLKEILWIKETI